MTHRSIPKNLEEFLQLSPDEAKSLPLEILAKFTAELMAENLREQTMPDAHAAGVAPVMQAVTPVRTNAPTLSRINAVLRTGSERVQDNGTDIDATVLDFWRWSASDLLSNATRGRFAEFLVAKALCIDVSRVRDEWAAWDLTSPEGITIEVKCSSYLQSWHQDKLSSPSFSIKASRAFNADTNKLSSFSERLARIYVFALLLHQDKATVDPLDLRQWLFYVVPTSRLNEYQRSQSSITLKSLQTLCSPVPYRDLRAQVLSLAGRGAA